MNNWIGHVNAGRIVGLFDHSLNHELLGDSQLESGDIVKVVPANVVPGVDSHYSLVAVHGSASARVLEVVASAGHNPAHTQSCNDEAASWLQATGIDDPALENLAHLPFVTIDNDDSKDLDQAVYVVQSKPGVLQVFYALADASYYVRPGTALFSEALERGVTYYVPGLSVPMLPRKLSEGLVSLNPDVERRALIFVMDVDTEGNMVNTTVRRAKIKSIAKLSYRNVQEFYDTKDTETAHAFDTAAFADSLIQLRETGLRRLLNAERRDVIDYNRVEAAVTIAGKLSSLETTEIEHDSEQQVLDPASVAKEQRANRSSRFSIEPRQRRDSERYNEQLSLMCNMEGARLLKLHSKRSEELQSIFRIHSPPLGKRLIDLQQRINQLAQLHELPEPWRWDGTSALSDYLEQLDSFIEPATERLTAIRFTIERMILLTNRASFFSAEPGPHHALGVDVYARFSSPMREVVGIFTHKELLECLGFEDEHSKLDDNEIRRTIIEKANEAKKRQKKLDKEFQLLAIDTLLQSDLELSEQERPQRRGTVLGIRSGRIYVSIDGFGVDLKLYLADLSRHFNCEYRIEGLTAQPGNHTEKPDSNQAEKQTGNSASAAPVIRTGDRVTLVTGSYDAGNRRYVLLPQ